MSINFQQPIGPDTQKMIEELFGKPVASDPFTSLFDELPVINRSDMGRIARAAGQPLTTELDRQGTIKIVDSTEWILTETGWRKLIEVRAEEYSRVSAAKGGEAGPKDGTPEHSAAEGGTPP